VITYVSGKLTMTMNTFYSWWIPNRTTAKPKLLFSACELAPCLCSVT